MLTAYSVKEILLLSNVPTSGYRPQWGIRPYLGSYNMFGRKKEDGEMRVMVVEGGSGPMVYCKGCGAIAGVSTKCECWDYHSFIAVPKPNQR